MLELSPLQLAVLAALAEGGALDSDSLSDALHIKSRAQPAFYVDDVDPADDIEMLLASMPSAVDNVTGGEALRYAPSAAGLEALTWHQHRGWAPSPEQVRRLHLLHSVRVGGVPEGAIAIRMSGAIYRAFDGNSANRRWRTPGATVCSAFAACAGQANWCASSDPPPLVHVVASTVPSAQALERYGLSVQSSWLLEGDSKIAALTSRAGDPEPLRPMKRRLRRQRVGFGGL